MRKILRELDSTGVKARDKGEDRKRRKFTVKGMTSSPTTGFRYTESSTPILVILLGSLLGSQIERKSPS
jgi:hypothetical protein